MASSLSEYGGYFHSEPNNSFILIKLPHSSVDQVIDFAILKNSERL